MAVERITAPIVKAELDKHLERHQHEYYPKLTEVRDAVFGPGNKGGLCDDVEKLRDKMGAINEKLQGIESSINKVLWIIILAVIGAVLKLVIVG